MQSTSKVTVVIGAGSIGQPIARRVSAGKPVVLADLRQENADSAAKVLLDAGFEVTTAVVDVSSRQFASRDGRGRALGQARSTGQHHQPRHHPHPAGQRRIERPAWRRLPPHDQSQRFRALRYT